MVFCGTVKSADLIWLGQRLAEMGRDDLRSRAAEVPAAEMVVMGDLLENPPSTITALAQRTGYAQSRVSTAVAGLVNRGWAQTGSDASDGRRTLVSVPDRIRRESERVQNVTETQSLDHLLAGRTPARRRAIIGALQELLDTLREQEARQDP
jgi:MarR family 2-MHQ and catechol resistance regulon transcriptional repressor